MIQRRTFLSMATAAAGSRFVSARPTKITSKIRVHRALEGQPVDRTPFTFWYHFLDETQPGTKHAESTLNFHRKWKTDLVKVMSDYPYPKPSGDWWLVREVTDPFPEQIQALQIIHRAIGSTAPFVETLFNPWNVAEKLSSKDALDQMAAEKPQRLADALEVIAKSQAHHARRAVRSGASGIFLAIANSSRADYEKLSEPFDRLILDAVRSAPMNTLHIHGDKVDLDRFLKGWSASILNYSPHGTGIPIEQVRSKFSGLIMGGIDERNYRRLTAAELTDQWKSSGKAAGEKFLLAPGCSVPNETTEDELQRLTNLVTGGQAASS